MLPASALRPSTSLRWLLTVCLGVITVAAMAVGAVVWESRVLVDAQGGLVLRPFIQGLDRPVYLTHANDGTGEVYIVERGGTVRRARADGLVLPSVVLDISDQVSTAGERGLLSIAFRPGQGPKTDFFAYYVDSEGRITVSRFALEGNQAGAETVLVRIPHQRNNHVGGQLAFGPDGLLYFATGDGGGANDPDGNGQNPNTLLAKLLRIDPDAQGLVTPEIIGMGLRNPYRFSFDIPGETLYLADVGQALIEEVNFVPVGALGGEVENYGWSIMEGDRCFMAETCDRTGLVIPDITYTHDTGCSIIGGYVYRGSLVPQLQGSYIYGDYCTGEIFHAGAELNAGYGLASFGVDAAGELYTINTDTGTISRIEPLDPPAGTPTPTPVPPATPTPLPHPFEAVVPLASRDGPLP